MDNNEKSIFEDKEKRKSFIILSIFSLAIIFVSVLSLKNSINKPFVIKGTESGKPVANSCAGGSCNETDIEALKLLDTDGDGLSDYEEIYIYLTSPYLEDTDGDGLTDYEEVIIYGTDPNCFEGRDCSSFVLSPDAENSSVSVPDNLMDLYSLLDLDLDGEDPFVTDYLKEDINNEIFSELFNISAEELRDELLKAGIPEEDLEIISDEDLLDIYKESLLDSL